MGLCRVGHGACIRPPLQGAGRLLERVPFIAPVLRIPAALPLQFVKVKAAVDLPDGSTLYTKAPASGSFTSEADCSIPPDGSTSGWTLCGSFSTSGPAEEVLFGRDTQAIADIGHWFAFQLGTPTTLVAGQGFNLDLSYTLERAAVLASANQGFDIRLPPLVPLVYRTGDQRMIRQTYDITIPSNRSTGVWSAFAEGSGWSVGVWGLSVAKGARALRSGVGWVSRALPLSTPARALHARTVMPIFLVNACTWCQQEHPAGHVLRGPQDARGDSGWQCCGGWCHRHRC